VKLLSEKLEGSHASDTESLDNSTSLVVGFSCGGKRKGTVLGRNGAKARVGKIVEDAADGLHEFLGLSLADGSFKIWIFLDNIGEDSESIALAKMIVKVTGCLYQFHHVIALNHFSECDLVFTQFSQYSMCV
jgi:hypothetical protein